MRRLFFNNYAGESYPATVDDTVIQGQKARSTLNS